MVGLRAAKFIALALACSFVIGLSPALGLENSLTDFSLALTIYPSDDAFVSSDAPDNTSCRKLYPEGELYSDIWDLWVGREWISALSLMRVNRSYLKFDLSSIPNGAQITSARLKLYRVGLALQTETTGAPMVQCYVANDDWDENTITWNLQPSVGEYLDSYENIAFWNTWDVTNYVQKELLGDKVASFMLRAEDESTHETSCAIFPSKEYDGYDPRLEVTYGPPKQGVSVSISLGYQSGAPGTTLSYFVTVVNTGTVGDNYALTATDDLGWDLSVEPPSLTIAAGQSADVVLRVAIPYGAPSSTEDNVTVFAASQTDPTASDSAICVAHAAAPLSLRLSPSDDAHVTQRHPHANYGDRTSLHLRSAAKGLRNERIFLKFDLSTLPEGATILEAKLYLYCWWGEADLDAQSRSVENDTWSEDTITWNNQPAYGSVLDTVALTREARGTWRSWDVTSFVQDEFAGDKVASFCLRAAIEDKRGWYKFRSKEYDNVAARPYLEVLAMT